MKEIWNKTEKAFELNRQVWDKTQGLKDPELSWLISSLQYEISNIMLAIAEEAKKIANIV